MNTQIRTNTHPIRHPFRRHCLVIAFVLVALAVLAVALTGCADLRFPRGRYAVHQHVLIIASWDDIASEYGARHHLYCGDREDGACVLAHARVMGFWDPERNEIWCAPDMAAECYAHELKHLLQLWDYRHHDLY